MMSGKSNRTFWLLMAMVLGSATQSLAQSRIGPPPRSPTLSPYLNLLRGPNDRGGLGFNYYMRTRPQQRAIEAEQSLNSSVNQLQRQQTALQRELESGLSPTGHQTSFLNTGGYFPLSNGR